MDTQAKLIAAFNATYITFFGLYAVLQGNFEFLFYVSIVVAIFALLLMKYKKLGLQYDVLWGLSIWGFIHMMGGNLLINGSVLYNLVLIPIITLQEGASIFKYDQLVHLFGFGVTTVLSWQLLKPYVKEGFNPITIGILVVMAGSGFGAINEVIEFIATISLPETNVGGYYNTSLDMVFNLLGGLLALVYIRKTDWHMG